MDLENVSGSIYKPWACSIADVLNTKSPRRRDFKVVVWMVDQGCKFLVFLIWLVGNYV